MAPFFCLGKAKLWLLFRFRRRVLLQGFVSRWLDGRENCGSVTILVEYFGPIKGAPPKANRLLCEILRNAMCRMPLFAKRIPGTVRNRTHSQAAILAPVPSDGTTNY